MPEFFARHLSTYALQLLRLCVWLLLLSVLFAPLERLFALHPQRLLRKEIFTDIGYYFLSSFLPGFLLSVPLSLLAWSVHRAIPTSFLSAIGTWPLWARLTASLIVGEIGFYWGHRWTHELPLLWRFHALHHSAEQMDFLVNTRTHPVDMIFTRLSGMVPLYILGLAAPGGGSAGLVPVLVLLLGTVWGFFIHSNLRWRFGIFERFIATPAFHHWHHTNDGPDYINKNYASMLPWIDQIFGTLYLPKNKLPARYGIDEATPPGLFAQVLHPFTDVRSALPGVVVQAKSGVSSPLNVSAPETSANCSESF